MHELSFVNHNPSSHLSQVSLFSQVPHPLTLQDKSGLHSFRSLLSMNLDSHSLQSSIPKVSQFLHESTLQTLSSQRLVSKLNSQPVWHSVDLHSLATSTNLSGHLSHTFGPWLAQSTHSETWQAESRQVFVSLSSQKPDAHSWQLSMLVSSHCAHIESAHLVSRQMLFSSLKPLTHC